MGVTYKELDAFLRGEELPDGQRQRVEQLHRKSEHKRQGVICYEKTE